MSREIVIPINNIDKFTADGSSVGITFRYRLKNYQDSSQISSWSNPISLNFLKKNNSSENATILQTNYSNAPLNEDYPTDLHGGTAINLSSTSSTNMDSTMPSSEITQITSNKENGIHYPEQDDFKLKWENPTDSNVKKFDAYVSWNMWSFLAKWGTLSAPTLSSGIYIGTLTLSSSNPDYRNTSLSFKTYLDKVITDSSGTVNLYAGPGTTTPGNTFAIQASQPYSSGNVFNIQSGSSWTSSGYITNITRTHAWTDYEYVKTSSDNQYEISFSRKMNTSKLTAVITQGGCTIVTNENLINYGVVPGMSLTKISGDGDFGDGIVSQVDYDNNIIVLSNTQYAMTTISQTFTVGLVDNTEQVKTARITSVTPFTNNLEVGQMIVGAGSPGSLGSGAVKITKINSTTSIDVDSRQDFTAGNLSSISHPTRPTTGHTASGDIVFIANNATVTSSTNHNGTIETGIPIEQYQLKPMFVQAIVLASNDNESEIVTDVNKYTLWSITKSRSTYFNAYATLETNDSTLPYSVNLTNMSLPYSSSDRNIGLRIYSDSSNGVSLPPTTTAVDYKTGTLLVIKADSQIPKNSVTPTFTSTTSNTMTVPASKTFAVTNTSNVLIPGMKIRAARTAAPTDYLEGIITSSSTTSITMYAETVAGSGTTSANWTISIVGGSLVTSLRL
jgi:hypothetical protein